MMWSRLWVGVGVSRHCSSPTAGGVAATLCLSDSSAVARGRRTALTLRPPIVLYVLNDSALAMHLQTSHGACHAPRWEWMGSTCGWAGATASGARCHPPPRASCRRAGTCTGGRGRHGFGTHCTLGYGRLRTSWPRPLASTLTGAFTTGVGARRPSTMTCTVGARRGGGPVEPGLRATGATRLGNRALDGWHERRGAPTHSGKDNTLRFLALALAPAPMEQPVWGKLGRVRVCINSDLYDLHARNNGRRVSSAGKMSSVDTRGEPRRARTCLIPA